VPYHGTPEEEQTMATIADSTTTAPKKTGQSTKASRARKTEHLTVAERTARGEEARYRTPPTSHAGWLPASDRPDPVAQLEEQNTTRDPDLVPVRHGRMMASPFTFYRGAAKIMATDLAGSPTAGLEVQLCGDAHLSNFGVFASPERRLMFDVNDFDETLPGPFEYDVKRLAASFAIAARNNGFSKSDVRASTAAAVAAYREAMSEFAGMHTMDVWYASLSEDDLRTKFQGLAASMSKGKKNRKDLKKLQKRAEKNVRKAHNRDSAQAVSKLAERVDGHQRIVSMPPVVVPARELHVAYGITTAQLQQVIVKEFNEYRSTLEIDRRQLLERFEYVDMARKVVGVGSVGTRGFIALLEGRDGDDPLFLQVKEATSSVLEAHLRKSRFRQPGERVVQGQRLMQATSDIFLGWSKGVQANRYYYWRQLRDMKGSAEVELMSARALEAYAKICGWTLARAHARSGDPVAIAAYLGGDDSFDVAITDFSERYADQSDSDYDEFTKAIRDSRIEATEGI
jgi:uncharacterized protein (DUF2252 family)